MVASAVCYALGLLALEVKVWDCAAHYNLWVLKCFEGIVDTSHIHRQDIHICIRRRFSTFGSHLVLYREGMSNFM